MNTSQKLDASFFIRNVTTVAHELLGKILVFRSYRGIITETEAYSGNNDEACHAFRGVTPRTKVMFGPPGVSYVYMIYGMYYCLNIVAEPPECGSAVLIRGLRVIAPSHVHLNGPGKICRHLGITKEHNNIDMTKNEEFYILNAKNIENFKTTPRIGITKSTDKLWRYII